VFAFIRATRKRAFIWARTEARRIWLRGDRVHCPICGGAFRRFIHYEGGTQNRCPRCFSRSRHRLMFLYMASQTDLLCRGDVLHFAAEPGLERHFRARSHGRYVTADLRNDVDVRADLTRLPFAPDSFDAVICSHILEHVPNDHAALRELFRVLRAGGRAMILVPLDPDRERTVEDPSATGPRERRERFGQSDHVRMYGTDFPARLSSAGFEVKEVKAADLADAKTIARYDLDEFDIVFICTKP